MLTVLALTLAGFLLGFSEAHPLGLWLACCVMLAAAAFSVAVIFGLSGVMLGLAFCVILQSAYVLGGATLVASGIDWVQAG